MNNRIAPALLAAACVSLLASCASNNSRSTQPQTRIVQAADGLNLVCEVRGSADTALVFLHGWGGDRHYWKHQVDPFAADYRVVTLDQAGFGESGKNRATWTIEGLAADVESVADALRLKRVVLIGHSMGGTVALMAAKRMPGHVVGVIGVDTLQSAECGYRKRCARTCWR
ncbi:MAG TPA: alpha/beta hydrolase [Verrucomicrobia bacterium]|nr:alpha/beta hydrolase [Verrucomicrobiota bacterium]HOB33353.1 alpha/beta hydrolase [Verrucomicrobiota bacterium]HOP97467.1 alpha/beta hydrolase [Verrucomicrobiota bacterium]HPU55994.1 alpha/beta hydrolase [Verrucomicrobiota bacterium]